MGGDGYAPSARESDGAACSPSRRCLLALRANLACGCASLSQ